MQIGSEVGFVIDEVPIVGFTKHDAELKAYRYYVFNKMRYEEVRFDRQVPKKFWKRADELFIQVVRQSSQYRPRYEAAKRKFWKRLYWAALKATARAACVRISFNTNDANWCDAHKNVIVSAVEAGLFELVRSKPGSPKSSRLIPLDKLIAATPLPLDPLILDPPTTKELVFINQRVKTKGGKKKKVPMAVDWQDWRVQREQEILKELNQCLADYQFHYMAENGKRLLLRPFMFCKHTDCFELGGRIYGSKWSHLSIGRDERSTIRVTGGHYNNEPLVSYDYQALHINFLYNRIGIQYQGDPYQVFGNGTTKFQRHVVKTLVNVMINAAHKGEAIVACYEKANSQTKGGATKDGKSLRKAEKLQRALNVTGLKFEQVLPLIRQIHHPINHLFFQPNLGLELQHEDSRIALEICDWFVRRGMPILPVHDGFMVPASAEQHLKRLMRNVYRRHMGFEPSFKLE